MTRFDNHEPDSADYSELELQFVPKFLALFDRVDAKVPHKGVRTLILRARQQAVDTGCSLASALTEVYEGAVARTERRLELIQRCKLKRNPKFIP